MHQSNPSGSAGVAIAHHPVTIPAGEAILDGYLSVPTSAQGMVLFAHGSGSSRHSPRNRAVAEFLNEGGLATLLTDLLTEGEQDVDLQTGQLRFNVPFLAGRLVAATHWLEKERDLAGLQVGYFGASTGAAAALVAAAELPKEVSAIVSRGGRPDLAGAALGRVAAPTLLIVGGADPVVLDLNRKAMAQMPCDRELQVIPGATHLFEEPGALDEVARLARNWFLDKLGA